MVSQVLAIRFFVFISCKFSNHFLLFASVTKLDGEISNRLENARKKVE